MGDGRGVRDVVLFCGSMMVFYRSEEAMLMMLVVSLHAQMSLCSDPICTATSHYMYKPVHTMMHHPILHVRYAKYYALLNNPPKPRLLRRGPACPLFSSSTLCLFTTFKNT